MEGYTPETIGLATAALYTGIFVGSLFIDRWIIKLGHIRSFILFASFVTVFVLAQALWLNPYYWTALRFLGGVCTAGIFIVIESWFLILSPPAMRGVILSIYLAIFYLALSAGQLLIHLAEGQLISVTGGFVLSYGAGAILGPIMAPIAMNCLGSSGLFYFLAGISFLLISLKFKKS